MNPVLIFESGIHTWEETDPPAHCRFATLSVVASSFEDLLPILNAILPTLGGTFGSWFGWYTVREIFEGNGIQKRNLLSALSRDIGNFRQPFVQSTEGILTSVSRLVMPISVLELDTLSNHRRELLVGTKDSDLTTESLSPLLAPLSKGADPEGLAALLESRQDLIVGRLFHDSDTHCAFQWFGKEADLRLLEEALTNMKVGSLASRDEVASLLRK